MNKYFNLIKEVTLADFKIRYKKSLLGFFWSFLKPLLMMLVLYFIFAVVLNLNTKNYVLLLLLGIIIWNFFVDATIMSMENIIAKRDLIMKVYFPRQVIVISSCLNSLIVLFFNLIIFFILMLVLGFSLNFNLLFFLIILIPLYLFSLGISYLLTALYVKYRDIYHIWGVFIQIGFWVTPIIYTIDKMPKQFIILYLLNPIARIIELSRDLLIRSNLFNFLNFLVVFIFSIIFYLIGKFVYKKLSIYFPEEI